MSKNIHRIYVGLLVCMGVGTTLVVGINGFRYYVTPQVQLSNLKADLDARLSDYQIEIEMLQQGLGSGETSEKQLREEMEKLKTDASYFEDWKPTGKIGHGLGVIGSAMMISGVIMYSTRKRVRAMRQWGKLKHWLEFHIFLCLLGPTLVLYHTTFKFGGIVAVSFWSMIAVVLSGIIGRYIYTQIPHGVRGNELSIDELKQENEMLAKTLRDDFHVNDATIGMIDDISRVPVNPDAMKDFTALVNILKNDFSRRSRMRAVHHHLRALHIPQEHVRGILAIAKKKSILLRRIAFLGTAQRLFHYWHVVHQPFSIIMFVILAVHVIVTISLGYRWIF